MSKQKVLLITIALLQFVQVSLAVPIKYTGNRRISAPAFVVNVPHDWRPKSVIKATPNCLWTNDPSFVNRRGDSLQENCYLDSGPSVHLDIINGDKLFSKSYKIFRAKGRECRKVHIGEYSGVLIDFPDYISRNPKYHAVTIRVSDGVIHIDLNAMIKHPFTSQDQTILLDIIRSTKVNM